jgi:hypothetical protein
MTITFSRGALFYIVRYRRTTQHLTAEGNQQAHIIGDLGEDRTVLQNSERKAQLSP